MITTDTNPWANEDAKRAVGYAIWHQQARDEWEATKNPEVARAMTRIQNIREAHQTNTGWVAEHQGDECWRFTYIDPDTRLNGGTPVTITTKETQS